MRSRLPPPRRRGSHRRRSLRRRPRARCELRLPCAARGFLDDAPIGGASVGLRNSVPELGTGRYRSRRAGQPVRTTRPGVRSRAASRGRPENRCPRSRSRTRARRRRRHVPNSCSNRSQAPNAPGTTAGKQPVPGIRSGPARETARSSPPPGRLPVRSNVSGSSRSTGTGRRNVAAGTIQMRLDDLQREAGGNSSVEGVAAAFQHGHACSRSEPVRGRDHPERSPQLRSRRELHPPPRRL